MSAAYCCNPLCAKPNNPSGSVFCQTCGQRIRLGDRYEAYSPLGSGNSSRTYVGLDTQKLVDPRCIIKAFVQAEQADVEGAMESFRREMARLAELGQHPQLPDIYAYFERGTQQYLVQEFVGGRSLLQRLTDEGSYDEVQIRELLEAILPVLHLLHEHRIIHRDVKPANLIERSRNQPPVLVGFGAVKHATQSALARTGTVLGSAEYAAPEQLVGKAVFSSDLYSLGVSCLQLLTGLRPFELFDSATGQWFWRSVAGTVSPSLGKILDRMIHANASDRYSSADEVMRDLGVSLGSGAVRGSKTRSTPRTETWICAQTLEANAEVLALALLPSGLVSGDNNGQLCLWALNRNTSIKRWNAHTQAIAALAVSSDGQIAVSSGWDRTLRVWQVTTGTLQHELTGHSQVITGLAISSGSRMLISGGRDRTLRLWNLETGSLIFTLSERRGAVEAIAMSGQILAVGLATGVVELWHLGTREHWRTLAKQGATVGAIALSSDGEKVVSSSWDMTTQVRNSNTGAVYQRIGGHALPVSAVAINPNDSRLVTGSQDGTLKLWDSAIGSLLETLSGHLAAVEAVVWCPPKAAGLPVWSIVSASRDGTIRLWHPQNAAHHS